MSEPKALSALQRLRYAGESALFFPFMIFFKLIGVDAASALGGFIGRHLFYRLPPADTARANLKAAYPQMPSAEIEKIVREMCDNLGRVVAEYPHLGEFEVGGPGARIEVVGRENGDAAVAAGKGTLFFSGHLGNWEMGPITAQQLGYDGALVYRPPNNPIVDRWIGARRAQRGPSEQISKGAAGVKRIFALLRRGKTICLLVDQKTAEGVAAPFFGRAAMTTSAPAAFALKLGSLLAPVAIERLKGAHFRITIRPALEFASSGDYDADLVALTAKINATIEDMVRRRPSQWLWIHRRWTTPRDIAKLHGKEREKSLQALGGNGVGVESEGSSFS